MDNPSLASLLETLKTDVLNSLQAKDKYATGQTAAQMTVVTDGDTARLELPGYLEILEKGRGPTSQNATPGNPPMIQRIQEWCRAKGIPEKAIWAIKKSIDKKGYKGTDGILSEPLGDDNINMRLDPALEDIAAQHAKLVANSMNI